MTQTAKKYKVALVDDHTLIMVALAKVINEFDDFGVILLASNGRELMEKLQPGFVPDLLMLDINMPEVDGYATAKWLRSKYPEVRVLVLTMYDSELAMIRLLQLGVRGFLKKDIHPSELKYAMEATMQTGYYFFGNSTNRLVNKFKGDDPKAVLGHSLTEDELRLLELCSTEMTYKEISMAMKATPRRVDYLRDALFAKLNVTSRVGLAMYAIRNGVITPGY